MPPPLSRPSTSGTISGPLSTGSRGSNVVTLQARLNAALTPSPNLALDGIFGPRTLAAVRAFQSRNSLGVDGVVGSATARALGLTYQRASGLDAPAPPSRPPSTPRTIPSGGGGPPSAPPNVTPGPTPPVLDLSAISDLANAIINGTNRVANTLLSYLDSDYVPQMVYDAAETEIRGAASIVTSRLRNLSNTAAAFGSDPRTFVTNLITAALNNFVQVIRNAVSRLLGLPIIGSALTRIINYISTAVSRIISFVVNAVAADFRFIRDNIARIAAVFQEIVSAIA